MTHPGARAAVAAAAGVVALAAPLPVAAAVAATALALQRTPRAAARVAFAALVLAAANAAVLRVALGAWEPGLVAGLRGAALLASAAAFVARTEPWEVVSALGRFPRTAVTLSAVLRMAPALAEDSRRLHDAGRVRGLRPLGRARLAAPLLVQTVRRGEAFGDALALAGFPSGAPRYRRPPWAPRDVAIVAAALAVAVLVGVAAWT